jgi:hypothetical protein
MAALQSYDDNASVIIYDHGEMFPVYDYVCAGEPADGRVPPAAAVRGRGVLAAQQHRHVRALPRACCRAAERRRGTDSQQHIRLYKTVKLHQ